MQCFVEVRSTVQLGQPTRASQVARPGPRKCVTEILARHQPDDVAFGQDGERQGQARAARACRSCPLPPIHLVPQTEHHFGQALAEADSE